MDISQRDGREAGESGTQQQARRDVSSHEEGADELSAELGCDEEPGGGVTAPDREPTVQGNQRAGRGRGEAGGEKGEVVEDGRLHRRGCAEALW